MTNYEKIKTLNIDEMADFFDYSENICDYCELHNHKNGCAYIHLNCKNAIKKWLESEAIENENT